MIEYARDAVEVVVGAGVGGRGPGAAPLVITVAEHENYIVISGETNGGPRKPEIPLVCRTRGPTHGRLVDMIVLEDGVVE